MIIVTTYEFFSTSAVGDFILHIICVGCLLKWMNNEKAVRSNLYKKVELFFAYLLL